MDEENFTYFGYLKKTISYILNIKIIAGFILLGIGAYAAFFVLGIIKTALTDPASLELVKHIESIEPEGIIFSITGGDLIIPATFFSYSLLILLIGTASSIAYKMISLGIGLVKIEIKTLLDKLFEEWKALRNEQKAAREQDAHR